MLRRFALLALTVGVARWGVACGRSVDLGGTSTGLCQACATDDECGPGAACARFGGGAFCASVCPAGNECASATVCTTLSTQALDEANACVPRDGSCGAGVGDGGLDGAVASCVSLAAPPVSAPCHACNPQLTSCQPNGCYDGWFCDLTRRRCIPPQAGCDGGSSTDGGFFSPD